MLRDLEFENSAWKQDRTAWPAVVHPKVTMYTAHPVR
jgi:hypothetical protein